MTPCCAGLTWRIKPLDIVDLKRSGNSVTVRSAYVDIFFPNKIKSDLIFV